MAKFYVNRGGGRVPEGPFEEAQIVKLILAGRLRSGHVSELGSQRFFPLDTQPAFARALTEAGVPPDPVAATRVTLSTKNTSRGLLLGAVVSIFGLALAAVAIGTYVMFSNGGMPIRGAVPPDAELLVEVRSVPRLLLDLHAVRAVDASRLLSKQFLDDSAQALSDGFGVSKAQASALLTSASSLGFAARKLSGPTEGGLLLSFSSATPVNQLLSSKRFTYAGLAAKSGRKYTLAARSPTPAAGLDQAARALSFLNLANAGICWFETAKVLFVGSPSFAESVGHVVALDVPSIEQLPAFDTAQRDLTGKPNVVGYLDTAKLGEAGSPALSALLVGRLAHTRPIGLSLDIVPAGLLGHAVIHVANPEARASVPAQPAPTLSLIERLPAESFAYVAASTETAFSGPELEKQLLDGLAASSPELTERVRAALTQSEQRLHVKAADILGGLGKQAAVALVARADYSVTLGDPRRMLSSFALVYVQALEDEAPARAACKALEAELSASAGPFTIEKDADGYLVSAADGGLRARLRFAGGSLFVALGDASLVERSWRAFSQAENTLSTNPAERAARAALPRVAQLVAWVDVGRVVDAVQRNPILALAGQRAAFDGVLAPRWTGPDRVTAGLTIASEHAAGEDVYRVDSLNLPIAAGAYGFIAP